MRLQLRRAVAALVAALLTSLPRARAEEGKPPPATAAPIVARAAARTTVYADTDNVTVVSPVATADLASESAGWAVHGQYLADVVSAASVDIVSTASRRWTEVRHAGAVSGSYQRGDLGVRGQGSVSAEPDYVSLAAGGVLSLDLSRRSHTVLLGYFRAHDTIGRTGTPFSVFSHTLDTDSFTAGATLTLDRSTNLALVADVMLERGDQSKPYRYIPMFRAGVAPSIPRGLSIEQVDRERLAARPLEQLPLDRQRFALTARLGHRFSRSTLRIDERLYADSWNLRATTTEARYFVELSRRLTVWPRLRAHLQTGTSFWRRAYVGALASDGVWTLPRLRTGDRELSPLATLGGGVGGSFGFAGGAHPDALAVVLQLDAMHTEFFDTLYLTSRDGMLVTLGLEGALE